MKAISIKGITLSLENVLRVETEETFSGIGEVLRLFAEGEEEPLEIIVDDAESLEEKIEKLISTN